MSINSLRFTMEQALQVAAKLGIDWDEVDYTPADFLVGMDIELEHGTVNPVTDVTGDDPVSTGKIALAHLNESGEYYRELIKMEQKLEHEEEEHEDESPMRVRAVRRLRHNNELYG